jgi:hypothetical protein
MEIYMGTGPGPGLGLAQAALGPGSGPNAMGPRNPLLSRKSLNGFRSGVPRHLGAGGTEEPCHREAAHGQSVSDVTATIRTLSSAQFKWRRLGEHAV